MPHLSKQVKEISEQSSAEIELSDGASDSYGSRQKLKNTKQETPVRQSARTAGKSFKYEIYEIQTSKNIISSTE